MTCLEKTADGKALLFRGFDGIDADDCITIKMFGSENRRLVIVKGERPAMPNRVTVTLDGYMMDDERAVEMYDMCAQGGRIPFIWLSDGFYQFSG